MRNLIYRIRYRKQIRDAHKAAYDREIDLYMAALKQLNQELRASLMRELLPITQPTVH